MNSANVMKMNRREASKIVGTTAASLALSGGVCGSSKKTKRHIVTLSFDDGFKKSSIDQAKIFEKYNLSACINVIASTHMKGFKTPDAYHRHPYGDFGLWNELQARGHEIMPHSFKHANLKNLPYEESKDLIRRCNDVFAEKLEGFNAKESIYNFAYLASTPDLEEWLPTQCRAFRTGFAPINPMPHKGQTKLTCTSAGPGNCEKSIDRHIEKLLAQEKGWLIFCAHGLDDEGWGPMRASYLDRLLDRLVAIDSVDVLPTGKAMTKYICEG